MKAPEAHPVVFALECKGCGRCVLACPRQVLALQREFNSRGYRYVEYRGTGCVGCGRCYYTCPEPGALEVHLPAAAKPVRRPTATEAT